MTKSQFFRLLRTVALFYLLLGVLVTVFQRSLIYHPSREAEPALLARARGLDCEPWRDAAGAIIGWKSARQFAPVAANRLVVFHGNAGYALHRAHYFEGFASLDGGRAWEVFLFEYPGYGARPGSPGEQAFIEAGGQALAQLAADSRPIFLLGESLGSGLACALAARAPRQVAGIFCITPFARLGDVAAHHYPFLPVRWLLRDRWDNAAALRDFGGPLAVLVAENDEVIPAVHGRRLFEEFPGPKRLWLERGARHNTLDFSPGAAWWREVSAFLLEARRRLSPP